MILNYHYWLDRGSTIKKTKQETYVINYIDMVYAKNEIDNNVTWSYSLVYVVIKIVLLVLIWLGAVCDEN